LLSYIAWQQVRECNKVLDTFVGALAMRKSLPRLILARQWRSGESKGVRGVDFGAVRERIEPAFA
jgi:hypothetical protein